MATVSVGLARENGNGVTLSEIINIVTGSNIASSRRVRAICDYLVHLGAITPGDATQDRRRRPLRFGNWLVPALLDWLTLRIEIASPWLARPRTADQATLLQLLRHDVDALATATFYPGQPFPELRFFLDHAAGYPILIGLIGGMLDEAGRSVVRVSRKSLARDYGLSRPHVAGMLAAAERNGWFAGTRGGVDIVILPDSLARLRRWPAHEIAWTVLALDGPG